MISSDRTISHAYRVRVRPNRSQARLLRRLFGAKRFVGTGRCGGRMKPSPRMAHGWGGSSCRGSSPRCGKAEDTAWLKVPMPVIDAPVLDIIGVDMGLRSLVTLSTGSKISAVRALTQKQARLRRYQRSYARKMVVGKAKVGLGPKQPILKGTTLPVSNRAQFWMRETSHPGLHRVGQAR